MDLLIFHDIMKIINNDTINIVKNKLVKAYQPVTIFLFGSYAWGNPTVDSDLDIMIIIDKSDDKSYIRPRIGFKALRGMNIAKDLIIYTKDEFNLVGFNSPPLGAFYLLE